MGEQEKGKRGRRNLGRRTPLSVVSRQGGKFSDGRFGDERGWTEMGHLRKANLSKTLKASIACPWCMGKDGGHCKEQIAKSQHD